MRVDRIGRDCELEISKILLMVNPEGSGFCSCARNVLATWFLGVRTMHTTQFCDSALFRVTVWTLFMDTVHEHCS